MRNAQGPSVGAHLTLAVAVIIMGGGGHEERNNCDFSLQDLSETC